MREAPRRWRVGDVLRIEGSGGDYKIAVLEGAAEEEQE
jgi:hypothetical protein